MPEFLAGPLRAAFRVIERTLTGRRSEARAEQRCAVAPHDNHQRLHGEAALQPNTEALLQHEQQRSRLALQMTGDAVIATDCDGCVTYVNPAAERMTGWRSAEACGQPLGKVFRTVDEATGRRTVSPVDLALARSKVRKLRADVHTMLIHRDGAEFVIEENAEPLLDSEQNVRGAVLVFRDVGDARRIATEMARLASHDCLTGLPNRAHLHDCLRKALALTRRSGTRLALMYLDIDNFKNINDMLGHQVGDQLLVDIAARLQAVVRSSDTISRQGGDEFIILLPEVSDRLAPAEVAQKLLQTIGAISHVGSHEVRISASIGIAVCPDDGIDADTLTRNADSAMYHAKASGRNNFQFFTTEMTEVVAERLRLETSLRRAVERNEFVLHYQPKIALCDGRIIGAEVLIRWRHPTEGLIAPGRFISAAEQSGLINPIGSWVLREACAQNQAWQRAGMEPIPMAVNLSATQLHHEGFLEEVTAVLNEMDMAPHLLEFEVTESVSIHGEEKAVTWLETLKEMGVRLSIDDFGTGYSSLSYLKRLPIDTIKIDQSFIRDITTDPDDAAIITAIIRMAHSLRLNVVAEGVETADQLAFLRRQNCNQVQGYYFSKPVPAEEFEQLLIAQAA
jgi:diguanylate cyclase (GGDEF)-like protein/PAS domain S-box-containing protein